MKFLYEKDKIDQGYTQVVGCDEVGRGCLAGPVVAAAVVLPEVESYQVYKVIKDSKLLSAKKREELSVIIKEIAVAWSIAEVSSEEIDRINIHNASLLAMRKAVLSVIPSEVAPRAEESIKFAKLSDKGSLHSSDAFVSRDDKHKTCIFIDGKFKIPELDLDQEAIVGGDNKVLSIAAASIIAKVYRDDLMQKFHQTFPVYNFAQHKGYATAYHRQIISEHGLCPIHRVTFSKNFNS